MSDAHATACDNAPPTAMAPVIPESATGDVARTSMRYHAAFKLTPRIFTLEVCTSRASVSNPYGVDRPSERDMEVNRRKSVARLLRVAALMLEQGRDIESIRDWDGGVAGAFTLQQDRSAP